MKRNAPLLGGEVGGDSPAGPITGWDLKGHLACQGPRKMIELDFKLPSQRKEIYNSNHFSKYLWSNRLWGFKDSFML